MDLGFAKKWLATTPSLHGREGGTVLGDLVCAVLLAMRAHPQDIPMQMLGLEAIDSISEGFADSSSSLFEDTRDDAIWSLCCVCVCV